MADTAKTYSSKSVDVIVGTHRITGYADGEHITVARVAAESFFDTVGNSGEVARSLNPDKRAMVTVRLLQTSSSNDYLSGIAIADELSLAGVVPISVRDASGRSIAFGEAGWVKKMPDLSFSAESGVREWQLMIADCDFFVGGN